MATGAKRVRLAELLASLSLATDLGTGRPLGHGIATTMLSIRLGEELGLDREQLRTVYQVSLLRFLGCTSNAAETARMAGGNEIAFNAGMARALGGGSGDSLKALIQSVGDGSSLPRRLGLAAGALTHPGAAARGLATHCEVAMMLARRLHVSDTVVTALGSAYERWDGEGLPNALQGEKVPLPVRISAVARDIDLFRQLGEDVVAVVARRRGKAYDPAVVDAWLRLDTEIEPTWEGLLAAEPVPHQYVEDPSTVLTVMADFADLKSPWTRGHSRRVASLAREGAALAGLGETEVSSVAAAGLVHDIGRVGVENGVWDRPSVLSAGDREKVRLHPYLTQRVLARCEAIADLADVASSHHERLDGSGYHRQVKASHLSMPARLLAAADTLVALQSPRPHRPAHVFDEARAVLAQEVEHGRLDREAVACVVAASGGPAVPDTAPPGGLTEREVEVLQLISAGLTNRQMGEDLFISPKTVGRHIENIYTKIGVSSRAAAAVYAMEHGLLE